MTGKGGEEEGDQNKTGRRVMHFIPITLLSGTDPLVHRILEVY